MRAILVAAVVAIGCGSSASSLQHAQLAHLGFDVPSDWHAVTSQRAGLATSIWTPEDNDAKESITIMRSERTPTIAKASSAALQQLLAQAQSPGARVSPVRAIVSAHGLSGARVEEDYIPPGLRVPYHRVHVILIDGTSIVHVLYTARTPDADLRTLTTVLGTLQEES